MSWPNSALRSVSLTDPAHPGTIPINYVIQDPCSFFIFFLYIFFSPNLIPNYIFLFQSPMLLSIHRNGPVARQPGRSRILESDEPSPSRIVSSFTLDRDPETSVSRALLYTAIQRPLLSLPPSLGVASRSNSAFGRGRSVPF